LPNSFCLSPFWVTELTARSALSPALFKVLAKTMAVKLKGPQLE